MNAIACGNLALNKFSTSRNNGHRSGIFSKNITIRWYRFTYLKSRESVKPNDVCITVQNIGSRSQYHGPIQRHLICLSCRGERTYRSQLWFVCELQLGDNVSSQLLCQPSLYCIEYGDCTFYDRINSTLELNEGVPFDKRIREKDSIWFFSSSFSHILAFFYFLALEFRILSIHILLRSIMRK